MVNKGLSNKPQFWKHTLMLVHLLISPVKDKPATSREGGICICLPVTGAIYRGSTVGDKVLKVYNEH